MVVVQEIYIGVHLIWRDLTTVLQEKPVTVLVVATMHITGLIHTVQEIFTTVSVGTTSFLVMDQPRITMELQKETGRFGSDLAYVL